MRRLLVRLVALETILVGWLAYWLFLVYASNPLVGQGLATQLGRFPQLSFTTVDISVLVIIVSLSFLIAFKFQRGLRPGIRLERALQMLENLMKRNLVLEAQAAELKLEKVQLGPSTPAQPTEPRLGSWERAFKTPLEAGPASPGVGLPPSSLTESPSVRGGGGMVRVPASKFEPPITTPKPTSLNREENLLKPPSSTAETVKAAENPASSSGGMAHSRWEESPKQSKESGAVTPSPPPKTPTGFVPISISKQPYIPVPVPKGTIPPGVIVGPGVTISRPSAIQARPPTKTPVPVQPAFRSPQASESKPAQPPVGKPSGSLMPVGVSRPVSSTGPPAPVAVRKPEGPSKIDADRERSPAGWTRTKEEGKQASKPQPKPEEKTQTRFGANGESKPDEKTQTKPKPLKKFPFEED